jgi:hypothetical protein
MRPNALPSFTSAASSRDHAKQPGGTAGTVPPARDPVGGARRWHDRTGLDAPRAASAGAASPGSAGCRGGEEEERPCSPADKLADVEREQRRPSGAATCGCSTASPPAAGRTGSASRVDARLAFVTYGPIGPPARCTMFGRKSPGIARPGRRRAMKTSPPLAHRLLLAFDPGPTRVRHVVSWRIVVTRGWAK